MVAYDIDTAAVMEAVRHTEAELAELASVPAELQRSVHSVEAALGSSRVAGAFTAYAAGELVPGWQSVLSRAEDAVHNVTQAVTEYLRADDEMRARAEAAAAAVPDSSGQRAGHSPPPVALPFVPPARPAPLPGDGGGGRGGGGDRHQDAAGPDQILPDTQGGGLALPAPMPLPQPLLPPQQEPDPEPETLVPLPGPPPWHPGWLFLPALPGRPPIIPARDLMLRLRFPCPGHWHPHPGFRPRWWGPAYPPGGWYPRWPEPGHPPGAWFPRSPAPWRPPGAWFPRWPEPGLPPQGRSPWWPARPLPGLIRLPAVVPPPDHSSAWPLENKQLPFALAVDGPEAVSSEYSSGKWGLT